MKHKRAAAGAGLGFAAVLVLGACSSAATDTASPTPVPEATSASPTAKEESADATTQPASASGSFVPYSDYVNDAANYDNTEVVLFFNASWCPTCNEAVESIENTGVPEGVTIVSVDFDSSQDLKQQYGVTQQHTFVQLDENGNEVQKFSGNITAQSVADQLV
ncbi:MAG: thioredoxin family protein [Actinomycetia bacterium]|nr:thioredoxin family protein [Actinomycetes bacterium]